MRGRVGASFRCIRRSGRRALLVELRKNGLAADTEKEVAIYYEGFEVGRHQLDIVVERQLIIELKTVEALGKAHYAQVRSYLKASQLAAALLVNFAGPRADFRRITFPHSPPFSHSLL